MESGNIAESVSPELDSIEAYTIHLLHATGTSEDIGMYMTMEVMQMLEPTFFAEKHHREAFLLFE